MLMLGGCLVLALAFSQATAYTLMAPKIYGQSMPASTRGWTGVVPYPFRTYQPSLPPQYYSRYYGDPYFAPNMQNADYFYSQDPYTAAFDDSDYYSNYLYYIPSRRLYYDQPPVDTVEDIQDYDDETPEEDNNFKLQREWWMEKNVMPNEDTDYDRFQFDDFLDYKLPKSSKKTKNKDLRKSVPKPRLAGIDGFGRKKEKEQVFGSFRYNPRRDEEQVPVYAEPNIQSDDKEVKELKKLYREPGRKETTMEQHVEPSLDDWMRGYVKKSADGVKHRHLHQQPRTRDSYEPSSRFEDGVFAVYNEGGQMQIPENSIQDEDKWAEYVPEEMSVFDTIKKLLALEDDSDQVSPFIGKNYFSSNRYPWAQILSCSKKSKFINFNSRKRIF